MDGKPGWDVPAGFVNWSFLTSTATSDVLRADAARTGEAVVVKILRIDSQSEAEQLFTAGTDAVTGLSPHPLVVQVVAKGVTSGRRPWIATPFFVRGSLGDALAGAAALEPSAAVELFVHVADTLAFTGSAGVLHRDVKPGNILLSEDGLPVLADFQTAARLRDGRHSATTASLTDEYAAPEVLLEGRYTAQSEVFSACASLVRSLGGRAPHALLPGEALGAYLKRVDTGTAADDLDLPHVPTVLTDLIRRGLARDPDQRPQGMADLASGLRLVQRELGWPQTRAVDHLAGHPGAPAAAGHEPETRYRPDRRSAVQAEELTTGGVPRRGRALLLTASTVAVLLVSGAGVANSQGWPPFSKPPAGGLTSTSAAADPTPTDTPQDTTGVPSPVEAEPGPAPSTPGRAAAPRGGATASSGSVSKHPAAPSSSVRGGTVPEPAGAAPPAAAALEENARPAEPEVAVQEEAAAEQETVLPEQDAVPPEQGAPQPEPEVEAEPAQEVARPDACYDTAIPGRLELGSDQQVNAGGPNFTDGACDAIHLKLTSARYRTYARACLESADGSELTSCGEWVYLSYPDTWDTLMTGVPGGSRWQLQMYSLGPETAEFSFTG
ncbi:hypothetical protein NUM3379_43060 [Kineococcus sp. NUM-3379]